MRTMRETIMRDEEALLPIGTTSTPPVPSMARAERRTRIERVLTVILDTFYHALAFMIPSFLRRSTDLVHMRPTEKTPLEPPKRLSTEYLDGVRGVASVVVFIFHWTHLHFPGVNSGYDPRKHPSLWQLPMIRFAYSGAAMVSIFFTVSGFVLTHRFVQKMHRADFAGVYPNLTSLAFRRALRLFLPALASCSLAFLCVSFGMMTVPTRVSGRPFKHGLWALLSYVDQESNPWTWKPFMKGFYNPQLWSISLEFRGSMVIFLLVLALARTRLAVRIFVEVGIIVHTFIHKRWDVALFTAGMLLAEMDVYVNESAVMRKLMQRKLGKSLLLVTLMIGIWISGYPRDNGPRSFGYMLLSKQWPHSGYRRRFWVSIGSIFIVGTLPFFPKLQSFFNLGLIRYTGKVSFALYLIHGLSNRTVGSLILRQTWSVLGKGDFKAAAISYVVSSVLYLPIIVWWSDVFWRAFDIPSTHFARWVEAKCANRASM